MRHLFYINPAAGKRDATAMYQAVIAAVCDSLSLTEGTDYEVRVSEKPGGITQWSRQAAQTGQELRIYA